jgi:hypothetical protein
MLAIIQKGPFDISRRMTYLLAGTSKSYSRHLICPGSGSGIPLNQVQEGINLAHDLVGDVVLQLGEE